MSVTEIPVAPAVTTTRPETEAWTPKRAASNGAVFLDEQRPGWADEIDEDSLALEAGCHCVLGQLYGSYRTGCVEYGFDPSTSPRGQVIHLGFFDPIHAQDGTWDDLTEAWQREIAARRSQP